MMAEALHFAIFAAVKRHEPVDPAGVTAAAWAALAEAHAERLAQHRSGNTTLTQRLDDGRAIARLPMWFMKENKWRAARYGLDTDVVTPRVGQKLRPMREGILDWLNRLEPIAAELHCADELAFINDLLEHGPSYLRQRAAGGPEQALRQLVDSTGADRPTWG